MNYKEENQAETLEFDLDADVVCVQSAEDVQTSAGMYLPIELLTQMKKYTIMKL